VSTTTVRRQETEPLAGAPVESGLGARVWLAVAGIVALTAAFMLPGIGSKSLWRDEGFTVSTVLRPWRALAEVLAEHETNAWLHAVALKAWSGFGSSVGVLRTFSAVGVLLSIPVIALLANKLADRRVAVVSALLLAGQGSVFFYGQQVRGYSFTVLFTLLAALAFAIEVRRPSNRALVGFVVASFALTSTNVVAITVVVCMVASLVALPAELRQWRRRGIALGAIVALSLPVALLISTHNEGGLYEVGLGTLWDVLMVLTGRSGFVGIVGIGILGVVALRTTWRVFRRGGSTFERWVHAFCLLWVVGPFVMAVVAALFKPVLSGRYMMISVPGICVYGAIGLVDLLSTWKATDTVGRLLRAGVAAAVAVASIAGVAVWLKGGEVEDWRGASELVFTEARQGDEVLFANDSVRLFFEYYRTRATPSPPSCRRRRFRPNRGASTRPATISTSRSRPMTFARPEPTPTGSGWSSGGTTSRPTASTRRSRCSSRRTTWSRPTPSTATSRSCSSNVRPEPGRSRTSQPGRQPGRRPGRALLKRPHRPWPTPRRPASPGPWRRRGSSPR
jgi:hypothetical protein